MRSGRSGGLGEGAVLWRGGGGTVTAPLYQLKVGPLWLRASIKAFEREWERKPGRRRAKGRLTGVRA